MTGVFSPDVEVHFGALLDEEGGCCHHQGEHRPGWGGAEGANANAASCCQLPPEDVKDFLEQVAAPRVNRGWEFLLPTDEDFVRKHPDVAHRQHMLWGGIQSK